MSAFSLPTFQGSKCVLLTNCADLPKIQPFMRKISRGGPYLASYRAHKGKAYVRLACHDTSLHIDIAAPGYFEKEKPKENYTIAELKEILGKTGEIEALVRMTGVFRLPLASLPADGLVRSFLRSPKVGKMSMSLTEGKIEFEGSSLKFIRWESDRKTNSVKIMLWVQKKRKISDEYFTDSLKRIEVALNAMILEKE